MWRPGVARNRLPAPRYHVFASSPLTGTTHLLAGHVPTARAPDLPGITRVCAPSDRGGAHSSWGNPNESRATVLKQVRDWLLPDALTVRRAAAERELVDARAGGCASPACWAPRRAPPPHRRRRTPGPGWPRAPLRSAGARRRRRWRGRRAGRARSRGWEARDRQRPSTLPRARITRALDDVLQLADVAGPGYAHSAAMALARRSDSPPCRPCARTGSPSIRPGAGCPRCARAAAARGSGTR